MRQRSWMMFVDGENLTIQAEKSGKTANIPKVFYWPQGQADPRSEGDYGLLRLDPMAKRAYYYTAVQGDGEKLDDVKTAIRQVGFEPVVFKKKDGKSKGVDITLARDMLCHAFRDHYEVAVLVAGDGDYCPLVEELKRLGRIVVVWFWDNENGGLSPALKLAADYFRPFS